jgi:hypothetical protein
VAKLSDLSPAAKWAAFVGGMIGVGLAALRLAISVDQGGGWAARLAPFANLIVALAAAFFLATAAVPLVSLLRREHPVWVHRTGYRWWCHKFAQSRQGAITYTVEIQPTEIIQPISFRIRVSEPARLCGLTAAVVPHLTGARELYTSGTSDAGLKLREDHVYLYLAQPPLPPDRKLVVFITSDGTQTVGPVERELD